MSYSDKAFEIVKRSINSAIFIDEKAKEFYSETPVDERIIEEKLSFELHKNFKTEGISLAVHKFNIADADDENLKKYLLKDRDLVLLDWELDGADGTLYSLKLLSEVVNYSHINFCCIYTSTANFDDILHHINSYFSGLSKEDYAKISNQYDFIDLHEFLTPAKEIYSSKNEVDLVKLLNENGIILADFPITAEEGPIVSDFDRMKGIITSFEKYHKSDKKEVAVSSVSADSNSVIVNNTFIFILRKDVENDVKPTILIKRISDELIKNRNSFIQLLGLEMQTIFNDNESFIDENLLSTSSEAFFTHRNHLKLINSSDIPFNTLIKKVLVEHATLRLRTAKLSLLAEGFLDSVSVDYQATPTNEEVASMNTFYNSVSVKSLNDVDLPNLNFGDIFFDGAGKYFLCITALCDCLRPEKIKQNYFFVVGEEVPIETANILGDTAFISYVSPKTAISWIKLESSRKMKADNAGASPDQARINNLEAKVKALEQFKFKPVYIQPHIYNVQNPKILDNVIKIRRIESSNGIIPDTIDNGDIDFKTIHYITTLRPNYTQRIANHAFMHPVRVGVDFVKI